MKRLVVIFLAVILFSCGLIRNGRIASVAVPEKCIKVELETMKKEVEINTVSAFTQQDLYRLRFEKMNRDKKRMTVKKDTRPIYTVTKDIKKNVIEVIQIIDDTGKVIATKKIN